ncbi:FtsX-like permease family protein [Amycolatopsis magusensis]|uniref:ABC transport system permease protein n=1 Tax=Amycolatopsis magusensis TaxID=882444 RepID=A0ABS4PRX4_9PSEU|nr:FtsX-like permease family protein [Amycolatopsis magusensis]MBP2182151.1 putative ABC transport system permease protein [Amycolatopsis magusensis]
MFRLALSSLRYRTGGFVASFLSLFLGAAILMTFASMVDTRLTPGIDENSAFTLTLVAAVVGSWGLIIVAFAVGSTLTLLVRQRHQEMALLRSIGATPAQTVRLVVGEAAVVAVAAGALAIVPSMFGGELLLRLLADTGQVAPGIEHRFGALGLGIGLGITFGAAVLAAVVATRRTAGVSARQAMLAVTENPRMSRKRLVIGLLLLASGLTCGVLTVTVFKDNGLELMAVAGQAGILSSIGLAVLSPALARVVVAVLGNPVRAVTGVGGYLTVLTIRRRTRQFADGLIAVILFTGIATGTLYLQAIENSSVTVKAPEHQNLETLNYVVIGMIAVFAAVMLINTLAAAIIHRRGEFGRQRLAGSTPPQVLGMVSVEGVLLAVTGIVFGSLAAVAAIAPYSFVRTGSIVPGESPLLYGVIVVIAALLTLGTCVAATRRAIRGPAIRAIGA